MGPDVPPASVSQSPLAVPLSFDPEPFLRVFHVNDSTDDQVLFQAACREGDVRFNWHVTDSAEKGISYLQTLIEQSKAALPVCWPDLVLLDIVMPRISGFDVLRFIRATPEVKHLPVVIWTGFPLPDHKERSLELGANLFLAKPVGFQQVVQLARELYEMVKRIKEPPAGPL